MMHPLLSACSEEILLRKKLVSQVIRYEDGGIAFRDPLLRGGGVVEDWMIRQYMIWVLVPTLLTRVTDKDKF